MPLPSSQVARSAEMQERPLSLHSLSRCATVIRSSPDAANARSSVAVTSSARRVAQSFQATMTRAKSSSPVERWYQPRPVILRQVKSVCQSWLGTVVLALNSDAALMTM